MRTNRIGSNRVAATVNAQSWLAAVECVVQAEVVARRAAVLRVAVAVADLADRAAAVSVEAAVVRVVIT